MPDATRVPIDVNSLWSLIVDKGKWGFPNLGVPFRGLPGLRINHQDPPSTLNWGYMLPNNGYLGPNRG